MKKLFALILVILMTTACLVSCGKKTDSEKLEARLDGRDTVGAVEEILSSYPANYIRTSWGSEEEYPYAHVISTIEGFNSYKEAVPTSLSYDENFFVDKALLIAVVSEGSGSVRHKFMGIDKDGTVYIDRIVPEVGTCDMAAWNIVIEIPREISGMEFTVKTSDRNTTDKVTYGEGYTHISSMIPEGWGSEILPSEENEIEFGIKLYPIERPESHVLISFHESFGICGTKLEEESTTIGAYNVVKYRGSNGPFWLYCFMGLPGDYTVEVSTDLAGDYADTIDAILLSLELSPDWIINRDTAIAIAEKELSIKDEYASATFDAQSGNWTVNLRENGKTTDDNHVIVMDWSGKIISE